VWLVITLQGRWVTVPSTLEVGSPNICAAGAGRPPEGMLRATETSNKHEETLQFGNPRNEDVAAG